jgi:FkbM family methyltransferase
LPQRLGNPSTSSNAVALAIRTAAAYFLLFDQPSRNKPTISKMHLLILMSLRDNVIKKLKSTSFGRAGIQVVRRAIHLQRKIANPGIPTHLNIAKVTYRGKQLAILHRRTTADCGAIRQCFEQQQYDMPGGRHGAFLNSLYQQILASGRQPLIVDCGANIGASVLWFLARYPQAHVIAIEPAPDNFELLQQNCRDLDVDLKQAGIAAADGLSHLVDPGDGGWGYQTIENEHGPEVLMLSMETLLEAKSPERYAPFLLKIDIEGAEKTLFAGDNSVPNRFPLIIMEPHDWLLPWQGSSLGFFRFHTAAGREFCMKHENIASIAYNHSLLETSNTTLPPVNAA